MSKFLYKRRTYGTLKGATAELVEACGGISKAAQLARIGKSTMFRFTDESDEHASVAMPADIIDLLERHCGRAIVTDWLAAQRGAVLFAPELEPGAAADMPQDVARIAEKAARLFGAYALAQADGTLSREEAASLLAIGDAMVRAYMETRGCLVAIVAGVAPVGGR